jgi:mannose/fructose-specific phosphotransferase system component IIA
MNEGKPAPGITGIVVTHGRLAEELVRTAELIVGPGRDLHAISGSDLCDETVVRGIRDIVAGRGGARVLVFVDYFGGSCCINSVRAVEGEEGVKVLSGVNLPVLLSFMTKRETMPFEELVDHLVRRGRESVKVIDL